MSNIKSEIKKVTIGAVAIRTTKKDGTPYMWKDKKTNQSKPRTMVSYKIGEDWYMGWSYKAGSQAEQTKTGDVLELKLEDDGQFKNWYFPKPEDIKEAENAALRAKIALLEGQGGAAITPYIPPTGSGLVAGSNAISTQVPGVMPLSDNPAAQDEPPF